MENSTPSHPENEWNVENLTTDTADVVDYPQQSPSEPHDALFFVVYYLPLVELHALQCVCRSLRDVIAEDSSLWRHIDVQPPFSRRITDYTIWKITSRASGTLRYLRLANCQNFTDFGLYRIVITNPSLAVVCLFVCKKVACDGVMLIFRNLKEESNEREPLIVRTTCVDVTFENFEFINSYVRRNNPIFELTFM